MIVAGGGLAIGLAMGGFEWMAVFCLLPLILLFLPFYLKNKVYTVPRASGKPGESNAVPPEPGRAIPPAKLSSPAQWIPWVSTLPPFYNSPLATQVRWDAALIQYRRVGRARIGVSRRHEGAMRNILEQPKCNFLSRPLFFPDPRFLGRL